MKWLRLYNEVAHDAKVQLLRPELFRAWINVLCLASANEERGTVPSLRQVAYTLRVGEADASALLDELASEGLLDRDGDDYVPHNWDERQPESDDAAARMRKARAERRGKAKKRGVRAKAERPNDPPPNAGSEPQPNAVRNVFGTKAEPVTNKFGVDEIRREEIRQEKKPPCESPKGDDTHDEPPPTLPLSTKIDAVSPAVENEDGDVDRVAELAEVLFPLLDYGSKVRTFRRLYRMDWLTEALRRAALSTKRRWSYVEGCYRGIEADGGLPARQAVGAAGAPPPNPARVSAYDARRARQDAAAAALDMDEFPDL